MINEVIKLSKISKKFVGNNGLCFGVDNFGKSAPYKDTFKHFGLTSDNIVKKVKEMINN